MKYAKRILSLLLLVTVIVAFMPVTDVSAATKINTTSKVIYVGSSYTLKITGTKKSVKWSSSNKSVATVTSKGKVTAISEGKATIKAKVGKKTYRCKVTAKYKFNRAEARKNISYTTSKTSKGVVAIFKNNNPFDISIEPTAVFFDSKGNRLSASSDSNFCLEKNGGECAMYFNGPMDLDYSYVDFDSFKLNISVDKSSKTSRASKITIDPRKGSNSVTVEVTNGSNKDLAFIHLSVVYYDASGKVIGYEYAYSNATDAGVVNYTSLPFPYDSTNYTAITPSSYKVYVDYAYTW